MTAREMALSGWGRWPVGQCTVLRPERRADIAKALAQVDGRGLIARGGGRAYGDQAINSGGAVLLTTRLDRLLDFDEASGVLVSEPGVTFNQIFELFLARGWAPPVSPGTGFATLAGAIANDVHGKNHDRAGSFGDHLTWIDLRLPDGTLRRLRPDDDLFAATVGGCGLTGVIERLALRLAPVPSNAVVMRARRMPDLDTFIGALETARGTASYSVGWIDGTATGAALGRGILETAEPSSENVPEAGARQRRMPIDFPDFALAAPSVRLFNEAYFRRVPRAGLERSVSLRRFLYPLDAVLEWNRIYGRRGFHQFQCVVPDAVARPALRQLMETISATGGASFLAVLKTLGGEGRGLLSFPLRGFTLALDFPRRPGTGALLSRLEAITLDHGGRIYLAKDSIASPESLDRMYPHLPAFRDLVRRLDPDRRLASDMARRLGLIGAAPLA